MSVDSKKYKEAAKRRTQALDVFEAVVRALNLPAHTRETVHKAAYNYADQCAACALIAADEARVNAGGAS